jgi:GT2 family glycosyltransferase
MQPQIKDGNVFLGTITHNGQLDFQMARIFYSFASNERYLQQKIQQSSLLASACNNLWCAALNAREKHNLKWFVLLHADVVPEEWFVDKLIALAEQHNADVMSAVVPIKSAVGLTSTAVSGIDAFNRVTRLTTKQINHPFWPETFSIDDASWCLKKVYDINVRRDAKLLVNTGCMVARLDRDWSNKVHFTINDQIVQGIGGNFHEQVEPEDWFFSRRVAEEGGKVMATRAVVVQHIGSVPYLSNKVWGEEIDPFTQAF